MDKKELYRKIKPFLENDSEGINWDFKKSLSESAEIIKDIMAFSNSDYDGESYIIVGVSETEKSDGTQKIPLSPDDRIRLNTDANYLYIPGEWNVHGLNAIDIEKMKAISANVSDIISKSMLISQPKCEFHTLKISEKLWLYVIIVKKVPGVFISKKDLFNSYNLEKPVVKQGVLYVRIADITVGSDPNTASAAEHIRVWKKYFDCLNNASAIKNVETKEVN